MTGSYKDGPRVLFIHFDTIVLEVYVFAERLMIERNIIFSEVLFDIWTVQFGLFNLCLKHVLAIQFDDLIENFL